MTKVTITFELATPLNQLEIDDIVEQLTDDYNTDIELKQEQIKGV